VFLFKQLNNVHSGFQGIVKQRAKTKVST